jgi:FecR protein
MSEPERMGELVQTLDELGKTAVPVEDPLRAAYRRERIVRLIGGTIASERRGRRRAYARPWLAAAAAAMVAVGATAAWRSLRAPHPTAVAVVERQTAGEARLVAGDVSVRRNGEAANLQVGDVLVGGEVVSTAAYSVAEIGIASGRAELEASSELEIMRPTASERRLRLGVGSVDVDLPRKLEPGKHLVVETPNADVLVVGTAFTVTVGRDHGMASTGVHVRRGTVWIMRGGKQRAILRAGDDWSSATPPSDSPPTPVAPDTAAALVPAPHFARVAAARPSVGAHATDSGSLAEENRLFQAGLTARNAGDNAGAADVFAGLLSKYPRSVLREQALAEEFRALDRAGRSSAAAVGARRYLAGYPNGFARADAERVMSALLGDH